jgi:hypothetical protein
MKRNLVLLLVASLSIGVVNCAQKAVTSPGDPPSSSPVPPSATPDAPPAPPVPVPAPPAMGTGPLTKISWEKYPENKPWSDYVYALVTSDELFPVFDKAKDVKDFCPNYPKLNKMQKGTLWTELFSAIAFYESAWSPVSRMQEKNKNGTPKYDELTGLYLYSEGLLQLSYQDTLWASYCAFDWPKDMDLKPKDPKKTILDPYKNLDCGVRIMSRIIAKRGVVKTTVGYYWAVIIPGGSYQQIANIQGMTKKLAFCQ